MAVRAAGGAAELRVPVIAASDITTDVSVFALILPTAAGTFRGIMGGVDAAGDTQWALGVNTSNVPEFYTANGTQIVRPTGPVVLTEGVWTIVGYTKTGAAEGTRRWHILELGGSWQHTTGDLGGSANPVLTTAGGYIDFIFDGGMAVAGVWKSVLSDAQAEALGAGLTSDDWAGHAITPAGAWNFNQADATDPVFDLTGHHDTITGTITGDSDPNGIDGTTIVFGDDPPGWDFTTTPPPLRVTFRYSGGASNADQALSIGGAESSERGEEAEGLTGVIFNILPDFDRPEAIAGTVVYRGFYVHLENNGFSAPGALTVWLEGLDLIAGVTIAIGAAPEGPGGAMQTLPNETTAPTGVAFSTPTAEGDAIALGEAAAEDGTGVWARVTLTDHLAGGLSNTCPFKVGVTPA